MTMKKKMLNSADMIYGYSLGNFVLSKQGIKDEYDNLILPNTKGMIIEIITSKRKGQFTVQWDNGRRGKEYRERKLGLNSYDIYIPVIDATDLLNEDGKIE